MFENDYEDAMSELATAMVSVTKTDWEDNIDYNVSVAFAAPQYSNKKLNPNSDVAFFKAIDLRGNISNLSSSIKSYNVSNEPCSMFNNKKPSFTNWEEVESTLKSVLNPEELSYVEAKCFIFSNFKIRESFKRFSVETMVGS